MPMAELLVLAVAILQHSGRACRSFMGCDDVLCGQDSVRPEE